MSERSVHALLKNRVEDRKRESERLRERRRERDVGRAIKRILVAGEVEKKV